ncbi:type VII secretion-associated serine protease mycosin [Mycolicibacterium chubuense NBB4]|uniref:Type VII secretion-associated serine protease mycosin n=1 Tax=Mycolicibacterium chubuense (strain NBB4) TaxID=710421 RepID=I4BF03_MYCCN|nr:type VII secretion-associated serine protease mycosin [Mycolicibacterium chubuense]AFM15860.1 type VII secretion-associated serine protease mycosin [Mycolicibacterium chubuense NBB4]
MTVLRLLAVTGLVVALTPPAPGAAAIGPPPVDASLLPPAGPAAPPRPTTRYDDCAVAAPVRPGAGRAGQLEGMDLDTVWDLTRGAGQTVAVIDTGVARHRRLPHLVAGGDFVSTQDGTSDCDGHGTTVAGIIAAAPDTADPQAFSGIAPDVSLLSIRQSSNKFRAVDDVTASGAGDVDTLAAAVRTAADLGATVVNISSVACLPVGAGLDDRALGAALAYAVDVKNVVVVTAAGNVGSPGQCPQDNPRDLAAARDVSVVVSPAWYDDYVLTVGSVAADGSPSPFTLAGPWVDVAATGEHVVSLAPAADGLVDTSPSGTPLAGTSYAAPVVSAVAALVRAYSPELTARQVMQRITDTAHHPPAGWDPVVGHGVVDPLAAVTAETSRGAARHPPAPPAAVGRSRADPQITGEAAGPGAVLCVALTVGVAVVCAALGRSRRRGESVDGE